MMNVVFLLLIAGSVLTGAASGTLPAVTEASVTSAKAAVELALGLVGQMGVWLGLMRVLQEAQLLAGLGRALRPLLRRLFPDLPADHPALGSIVMNLSANILGLGNAATPFGLRAMRELETLNPHPGVATNAMARFLVINTSGVAVLPLGVVAIRATLGSRDPAGIVFPTVLASLVNTGVAVAVVLWLERWGLFAPPVDATQASASGEIPVKAEDDPSSRERDGDVSNSPRPSRAEQWMAVGLVAAAALLLVRHLWVQLQGSDQVGAFEVTRQVLSEWMIPLLMLGIVAVGVGRGVRIYEAFIAGAKESFHMATTLIPYLLAILVGIGMLRASGALGSLVDALSPVTRWIGLPAEALPMALIRPLSGSGALAVMTETLKSAGPDSLTGWVVSILNGTSETTFYVLAVYYGSVGVRAVRHTLVACLVSDLAGLLAATAAAHLFAP